MVEAEVVGPVADHTPPIKKHDAHHDDVEHHLGAYLVPPLQPPVDGDSHGLRYDAYNEEVGERQSVVRDHLVLQGCDDGHGRVEGIAKQEVSDEINQALLKMPNFRQGLLQLPEADADDVHAGRDLQSGTLLLYQEPGDRQDEPDGGGEGDEDAQTPVVGLGACIHVDAKQDTDDDGKDDDLAQTLYAKGRITKPTTLHLVLAVVIDLADLALSICARGFFKVRRVTRQ